MFAREEDLVGLLLVTDPYSSLPLIEGADQLIIVIRGQDPAIEEIELWMHDDVRVQVRRVTPDTLERWLVSGDRRGVQWLVQGEVLSDDTGYLEELRLRLDEWPVLLREQKLLFEFSGFIMTYLQAKQDLQSGQVLDAYSQILASLHFWAHIALVEQGILPEITVWEQMRKVNPGIYKLYEELTVSSETLEKRVQLVLLACEFSVLTKMRSSCGLLLQILESRKEPWTVAELQRDARLRGLRLELSLLLQKLVQRGLAREVAKPFRRRGASGLELRYTADGERLQK